VNHFGFFCYAGNGVCDCQSEVIVAVHLKRFLDPFDLKVLFWAFSTVGGFVFLPALGTGSWHMMDGILCAFVLSLVAGAATGIGGLLVLLLRRVSDRVVPFSMGFASGVMLLVSFNNLFLEAEQLITHFLLIMAFSLGVLIIGALDLALPAWS